MLRGIVFFATAIVFCESSCWVDYVVGTGCEYRGQWIEPDRHVKTEKDCLECTCRTEKFYSILQCCSDGPDFRHYPETCKVEKDERDCQRLVLIRDESIECTEEEGPIMGVGR